MKSVTKIGSFALATVAFLGGIVPADADCSSAGGELGNGVSWNIEDEVLVIFYSGTGSGEMPDYTNADHPPWFHQAQSMTESVRAIVIEDGITRIGNYEFFYCTQVEMVTIPGSVKTIGAYSFSELCNIKSLTIPEGVVEIKSSAFESCTLLETVVLPDSLKVIEDNGLGGNIKSITFGSGIESLGVMWSGNPCCMFMFYLESSSTPISNLSADASPLAGKTFEFSDTENSRWRMFESSGDHGVASVSDGITEQEIPVCSFAAAFIIGCLAMMILFNRH